MGGLFSCLDGARLYTVIPDTNTSGQYTPSNSIMLYIRPYEPIKHINQRIVPYSVKWLI